jgi:NADPH:quinone reductase
MHSMPINPNDRYIVSGFFSFGAKGEFKGVGFEGSGVVVETGSDVDPEYVGKKVAILGNPFTSSYQGSWREYVYCEPNDWAVYPDDADFDSMCSTFINPLATVAMMEFVKKKEAKWIVQDAACSSLGKMVCRALK